MTTTVPDNIATFSPSHGLPIPKEAMLDVFGAAKTVIPQLEKVAGVMQAANADFFKAIGLTQEVIDTFAKAMGIASTVASVIPYVNIAMALINILMSLKGGGDLLGELVKGECPRLHERLNEADRRAL